ncbi:MAG TPA: MnhB domain-containing protein [Streptosporangiales bacterium]
MPDADRRGAAPDVPPVEPHPPHRPVVGAVVVAGMAALLAVAFLGIPREHAPLPAIARRALLESLPRWHLTEPVNSVVYGSRAFDTFGETFLLIAAVVSVIVLTRTREARHGYIGEEVAAKEEREEIDPARSPDATQREARSAERGESEGRRPETPDATRLGTPGPEHAESMTVIVRTAMRAVAPILAVTGLYLVAWGYAPGGGFPAGAVMLGVILLLYAGFGYRRIGLVVRPAPLEVIELAGAAGIILLLLLGLFLAGSFTANWLPLAPPQTIRSGGTAQVFSVGELVEVGAGLTITVFALLGMRHDWAGDEGDG